MFKPWLFPLITVTVGLLLVIVSFVIFRLSDAAMSYAVPTAGYTHHNIPPPPDPPANPVPDKPTPTVVVNNPTTSQSEDTIVEPEPAVFRSSVPCYTPMTSTEFNVYKERVAGKSTDEYKLIEAKDALTENCLSTEQIGIILNLFWHEETKLEWAKFAYRRSTDHERYGELYDLLRPSSASELREYIDDTKPTGYISPIVTGTESPGMPCTNAISETDFTTLKEEVEDEVSDDSKLDRAKEQLGSKCLTVQQVEEVMTLFSFSWTKLEWAKFAYHKTSDTKNYPDLYDSLGLLSSKYELEDYIEQQQNR